MNDAAASLLVILLRTSALLAVAAVVVWGLLRIAGVSSPAVHRVAWCLVLLQGWLWVRLPMEIPCYPAPVARVTAGVPADEPAVPVEPPSVVDARPRDMTADAAGQARMLSPEAMVGRAEPMLPTTSARALAEADPVVGGAHPTYETPAPRGLSRFSRSEKGTVPLLPAVPLVSDSTDVTVTAWRWAARGGLVAWLGGMVTLAAVWLVQYVRFVRAFRRAGRARMPGSGSGTTCCESGESAGRSRCG